MASVTVNPPKTPVTKGSNGIAMATVPNVCKMPGPPAPFVPTPLPSIGKSGISAKGYSTTVKIEGSEVAIQGATFESIGDLASKATGGGLISSNTEGPTKFVGPGSLNVRIEGKSVHFLSDPMLNNCGTSGSPPNAATLLGLVQPCGTVVTVQAARCPVCGKDHGSFGESAVSKADASALASQFHLIIVRVAPERYATMLGVVECGSCSKKYGDHSSGTLTEFARAASNAGIKHRNASASLRERQEMGTGRRRAEGALRRACVETALKARLGPRAESLLTKAEARSVQSKHGKGPTAYPVGACAAQRALILASDSGAIPKAMTERYYSYSGGATGNIVHNIVDRVGMNRTVQRAFTSGESVPPCQTCELIVPALICPQEKTTCRCH